MHSLTLLTVNIPMMEDDLQSDQEIMKTKDFLKQMKEKSEFPWLLDLYLESCNNLRDTFSRAVNQAVTDAMEPYSVETDNPNYLEFCDKTADLEASYNNNKIDCIKLAEGRIVSIFDPQVYGRFTICNGKVYKRNAGSVKHTKRTKQAKRMTALPDYPIKKLYKNIAAFAEDYYGYSYNQEESAYGYYCNPDAFYDWYSIGGRWPELFLVKDSCTECSIGERSESFLDTEDNTPKGYKWVCAARKKDIEWQVMLDWEQQKAKVRFKRLEKLFTTGERDNGVSGTVTPDGILYYGKLIYKKDESEENYLQRMGYDTSIRYPAFFHQVLNNHDFQTRDSLAWDIHQENKDADSTWQAMVESYIDALSDDTVLVGVDCHI